MKKKLWKYIIPAVLIGTTTLVVAPLTLTSCSFENNAPNPIVTNTKILDATIKNPPMVFQSKTISQWKTMSTVNPEELLQTIKDQNFPEISNVGFEINDSTTIVGINSTISNSPILQNMVITLQNEVNQELTILRLNINDIPAANLDSQFSNPPQLGELKTTSGISYREIDLQQVNMPTIQNKDPQDISQTEWTTAINLASPNDSSNPQNLPYIPIYIYRISSIQLPEKGNDIVTITYSPNEQYKNLIESQTKHKWNEYCNIVVKITLSPYLNKNPQSDFELNTDETTKLFGSDITLDSIYQMNQIDVYNKLKSYVDSLSDVQPLRNCMDSANKSVYSYKCTLGQITFTATISFSTNPNDSSDKQYQYVFVLHIPTKVTNN